MAWLKIFQRNDYTFLPESDGVDTPSAKVNEDTTFASRTSRSAGLNLFHSSSLISALAITGCMLCTGANLLILGHFMDVNVTLDRFTPLPRPNPFIGLANVNRTGVNTTQLGPVVTWPALLTQISSADKNYIYPVDSARFFTSFGTVSPGDQRFQVNHDIHTITQFRARDFGAEDCQIALSIPPRDPPIEILGLMNYTVSMGQDIVQVGMWRLSPGQAGFMNPSTLSWNSRPRRSDSFPMHTFTVERGSSSESKHFPCPQDSVHTFEFACVDYECSLDFWQNGFQDVIGVYMKQHITI